MLVGIVLMAFIPAGTAFAGQGNSGDVWTDNVGQQPGPGHEQDVHLSCNDNINIWGAKMADSNGSFTVYSWPPSGSQESVYNGNWSYNPSQSDPQIIGTINVTTLINTAAANGDSPQNKQGYHFKLQVSQDPSKYKTFWVNCPPPSSPPPQCGENGGQQCPPTCGEDEGQQCPPPKCSKEDSCQPGPTGPTGPQGPQGPPGPGGQSSPPQVIVVTTPPKVVVVPCPCHCNKPGKSHATTPKCPSIKRSQFRLWFRPIRPISHGVVTFHATAPKSAGVGKVVLTIRGHENGHSRILVFHGSSVTKPINVANTFYWGVTYLHGVDVGTWGHYTVTAAFFLKCGKKVIVTTVILNNDPPRGVTVRS
jgi:hypothetical protein